jgi:riboflavin kinase/FMN adenylyltransferase
MTLQHTRLEELPDTGGTPPLAIAVGVFDGVHRGHQALLAAARREAPRVGAVPAALTFHPHPMALLTPDRAPRLLCTLEERVALLREHGAEVVVVARFDEEFAAQAPEAFIEGVLVRRLSARALVIGDDFRYGKGREGDAAALTAAGARYGFDVLRIPHVLVEGVPARSSIIRQHVGEGQVEAAAALLGRPFRISGEVTRGKQLGRTIGYPTANVSPSPEVLIPGPGVYAGRAYRPVDGSWHRAAISVGTNPTVAEDAPTTVEAFLMDNFRDDLYGEHLTVELTHYLRGMEKFASLDALIAQMDDDVARTAQVVPRP